MRRIGFLLVVILLFAGIQFQTEAANTDTAINKNVKVLKTEQNKSISDSVMYNKLTADQILEIKKMENDLEKEKLEARSQNDMPLNGFEIFLICAMPFLLVAIIFILNSRSQNNESLRRHELYKKSIEMGQTIPEHLFETPKKNVSPTQNLKRGVLWLSIGLAALIYFIIIHQNKALIVGIVPTFLGVGYLLVYFLEKPRKDTKDEQNG